MNSLKIMPLEKLNCIFALGTTDDCRVYKKIQPLKLTLSASCCCNNVILMSCTHWELYDVILLIG